MGVCFESEGGVSGMLSRGFCYDLVFGLRCWRSKEGYGVDLEGFKEWFF